MTDTTKTLPPTMAPQKKKPRKKWPWVVLALLVVLIAWLVLSMGRQVAASYKSETVTRRDLRTYYSFSGNLTPVTEKTQTAKDTLKIKELFVEEGDEVAAGQPLFRATDGTRVSAQETGTIETLYVDVDDQLQPGTEIAHIVDYDTLEITVDVDEYDVGALAVGKQGEVYINALGLVVPGQVRTISRNATTDGGVSYYQVKLQIDATEAIRSGMSVEVNVLNQEAVDVPTVSVKALSYDEYNKPYVLVQGADEKMAVRYIQLGVSDGLYTQITEGLADGETLYYVENDMLRFYMMQSGMGQNNQDAAAVMGN